MKEKMQLEGEPCSTGNLIVKPFITGNGVKYWKAGCCKQRNPTLNNNTI
jgi:hypothetical protein